MKARKKNQEELVELVEQEVSPRKTQLQMDLEQLSAAEKYGVEARCEKRLSERYISLAKLCTFLAALALLIVTVINLPIVDGKPLVEGFRGMRQLASVMLVSGLFNIAAYFLANAAKKHSKKSYDALLKRESIMPRETPVLVKMVQN